MLLEPVHHERFSRISYLLGCRKTGEALVVDPHREAEPYLERARAYGLRITHVAETHVHVEFVSGALELARRAGARLLLSAEGDTDGGYGYARTQGARLLGGGDRVSVGRLSIEAVHVPGHTPEHLALLVTDTASADRPMGAFTGDFLLAGEVGRPEMLGRGEAPGEAGATLARALFRSLRAFTAREDWLQLWPGRAAPPAGRGGLPATALGYEKRFNPDLRATDEEAFVARVLADPLEAPRHFSEIRTINRQGPRVLDGPLDPPLLPEDGIAPALDAGLVVDTRPARAFAGGHVPGSVGIPLDGSFAANTVRLLPYDRDLFLLVDEGSAGREAARVLAELGLDRVRGLLPVSALGAWARGGGSLRTLGRMTSEELRDRAASGRVAIVDVRERHEWATSRIAGALHLPLGALAERASRVPSERPLVLVCASGARSAVAAGFLQHRGMDGIVNLEGGIAAWIRGGHPVELGAPDRPPPTLTPETR